MEEENLTQIWKEYSQIKQYLNGKGYYWIVNSFLDNFYRVCKIKCVMSKFDREITM